MIMTNNKKNDEVSNTMIMILNLDVNFNLKKTKREDTNISVNINMRTSIVMEKLKPEHQPFSVRVGKHIIGDH